MGAHGSTGHVFHPGHEELHGVTVVVTGHSGTTWVGRYHERNDRGILLNDVGIHDPAGEVTREQFIGRILKFGVPVNQRHVVVPNDEVATLGRLSELG